MPVRSNLAGRRECFFWLTVSEDLALYRSVGVLMAGQVDTLMGQESMVEVTRTQTLWQETVAGYDLQSLTSSDPGPALARPHL